VDHKFGRNGDDADDELWNLQFLCPMCHAIKPKTKVGTRDEEYKKMHDHVVNSDVDTRKAYAKRPAHMICN